MDQTTKKASRTKLLEWLDGLTDEQYQRKSVMACEHLASLPEFQNTNVIMMFLSLTREILTSVAISAALDQGKTVLVPMVNWHDHSLIPVALASLEVEMESDRYGLRHPVLGGHVPLDSIAMIVVAGVGFVSGCVRGCSRGNAAWAGCGTSHRDRPHP